MTIPGWLDAVDEADTMTQIEIAERCGVNNSQVSRWKLHGHVPQGVAFVKLIDLSRTLPLRAGKPLPISLDDVPIQKRGPKSKSNLKRGRGRRAA